MEATAQQGVGEVRRLHIIYFISRKDRIEHPHLIRVHHLSRNGVRLRDIKRWLSELRGKDMPESYAWSSKRWYKTGFVWQDLVDEDLITPIADNEYVLKGSEIPNVISDNELLFYGKEGIKYKEQLNCEAKSNDNKSSTEATFQEEEEESPVSMSTKPLHEIEEQSSTYSSDSSLSLSDDSPKLKHKNHSNSRKERGDQIFSEIEEIQEPKGDHLGVEMPFIPNLANHNKKIQLNNFIKAKKPDPTPDQSKVTKIKSYSNNATNIFRNLMPCRTVDTKDSSMMVIKRRSTSDRPLNLELSNIEGNPTINGNQKMAQIRRGDIVGGSERISKNSLHETQENDSRRYSTGFVWQGLLDEDLITPMADNEYVLNGSEILSVISDNELLCDGKEGTKYKEQLNCKAKTNDNKSSTEATFQEEQESPVSMLKKPLHEIEEQSSTYSSKSSMSLTDDSPKLEHKNHSNSRKERGDHIFPEIEEIQEAEGENLGGGNNFNKANKPDPTPDQSKFKKIRSYSNNASNKLRNFMSCGVVDTKDSSMVVIKRSTSNRRTNLELSTIKGNQTINGNQKMSQIFRRDTVGGSERISKNSWHETQENDHRRSCDGASQSRQKKKEMNGEKPVPPAYKPKNGPNCSLCGKTFDPNHLHKHMTSCRGMKALAKAAAQKSNI